MSQVGNDNKAMRKKADARKGNFVLMHRARMFVEVFVFA
jgi:hypothetical protein